MKYKTGCYSRFFYMTKILSIVWYKVLPAKYGGQKGIAGFNKYLGRSTELTCLCSRNNENISGLSYKLLPVLPENKWQFINPFAWQKIKKHAVREEPTHIILEHPYHAIAGWLAKRRTGAKLIIHSHNIEYLRFRELGKWWWKFLYYYERWAHRKADLNLFKTTKELDHAVRQFKLERGKCIIIPYGIDPEETKPDREEARQVICKRHALNPQEKILLFAGTLDYRPNANAAEYIYRQIVQRLKERSFAGKIIICGRNTFKKFQYLKKFSHQLVIQAGEVTDIENYFAAADVFINPVITGGGLQTKLIEAWSHRCPVAGFKSIHECSLPEKFHTYLFTAKDGDGDELAERISEALASRWCTPPGFINEYSWKIITGLFLLILPNEG